MRGIASRLVVSSLLFSKSELGESPEMTLFSFASVWIFASWDYRRLHTSNAPISSAIRMTSTTSTLTGTYRSHPRPSTLVVTRKASRMLLFYGNQFGHRLVQDLTTWATWERGVDRRTWNHNRNIGGALWRCLLGNAWLGIRFEVRRVVRRLISIFELGFGSVNLKRMTSEISSSKKFQGQPPGK